MNVVQLHERVRFWLDRVGTTRFEPFDIDNAINIALNDIVEEKYAGSKLLPGDSFQKTQKLRDELSNIVKVSDSSSPGIVLSNTSGNSLITFASLPVDYRHLLAIAFYQTAAIKINCWPLTYDRINVTEPNPYRRVRTGPFPKIYYNESSLGINIQHSFGSTPPNKVIIHYLANPVQFVYGIERDDTYVVGASTSVISVSEQTMYGGAEKIVGTKFNIVPPVSNITAGLVVSGYTESDINANLHESIARRAAVNALITIGENEKSIGIVKLFD